MIVQGVRAHMMEGELQIGIPKMWITEIPKRHEVSIRIVNRRPAGKYGVRDLVEVHGAQAELEAMLLELREEPWVKAFDLDFVDSGRLMGEVVTYRCLACAALAASNCHLLSANVRRDGTILWRIMTSNRDEVRKLVEKLKRRKCEVKLMKLTPIDEREVLTGRQEEIIIMAFERGFFETPRRTKLKDLAKLTGVSQATLSEILRKGQKRIMVDYLLAKRKAV
ncbi:MAG: helix-turn-helix domain-containing protein [Thermoplasmata archaeon]